MSTTVSKTFQLNDDLQSLEELWESIAKLADGRLVDSAKGDDYPLELRMRQTAALRAYLECLEETHEHLVKSYSNTAQR